MVGQGLIFINRYHCIYNRDQSSTTFTQISSALEAGILKFCTLQDVSQMQGQTLRRSRARTHF